MVNEMKLWVNGQEVQIPNELQNLVKMILPQPQMKPQNFPSVSNRSQEQSNNVGFPFTQGIPRNIRHPEMNRRLQKVMYRDEYLRNVVIDMNRRMMEIEKLVDILNTLIKDKKILEPDKKVNTKPKEVNTKPKVIVKPKIMAKQTNTTKAISKTKGKANITKKTKGSVKDNTSKTKKIRNKR